MSDYNGPSDLVQIRFTRNWAHNIKAGATYWATYYPEVGHFYIGAPVYAFIGTHPSHEGLVKIVAAREESPMPDTPPPENPGECESCHYETPALTYCADRILRSIWLCDLCAGTLAGNAAKNPVAYPHADVLRTICYVGNVILAEIRRKP